MFLKTMRRIRRGFTILREQSYVSYASLATVGGFCDIDLIIIKATAPDDFPLPEKYVHQLLKIFSISPESFRAFSISFTRRFGKTHSWRVALKCLILLHRLLRSVPESDPFRSELLWARSNGLISLSPCRFRDDSSRNYEHYTMFIKSYAHLLDEALDCYAFDTSSGGNSLEFPPLTDNIPENLNELNRLIETLPQLLSLIDRVMDCRPSETISRAFMVQSAMKHIIRESFISYKIFKTEISVVLDSLFQLQYRSCKAAFNMYKSAASQADGLNEFYDWCRSNGICGAYEYPHIQTIPKIHVQALETFLGGMWQLTETESSTPSSSSPSSMTGLREDGDERKLKMGIIVCSGRWEKFEDEDEIEPEETERPLIDLEEQSSDVINANSGCWESLLEASVKGTAKYITYNTSQEKSKGMELQVYNPFHHQQFQQPYEMQMSCVRVYPPSNPAYPWGL